MKKSLLLIASLTALVGCANDFSESETTLDTMDKVSFRAVEPSATRTTFDDQTMTVSWAKGDKVSLWAESEGVMALSKVEFTATEVDASGAEFEALLSKMERGEYTYYSVYPTPAKMSGMVATYNLPTTQMGEYDCSADVLVAEPAVALALTQKGANLDLAYHHALHALKIEIPNGTDNYGNVVERVVLDFPKDVTGEMTLDVASGESTIKGSKRVTINCTDKMSADGCAWAFIAPVDCADEQIQISIVAGGKTNTFEVDGRNFRAGYLSRVKVAMPEVLILEEARTLIDNNSSKSISDPTEARLIVRLGGADNSSVVYSGVEYVAQNGDTVIVNNKRSLLSEQPSLELGVTGLASGVYSMRAFVELSSGEKIYSEMAENVRVVGNFVVSLGDVKTSYNYYVNDGASVANTKSGTSIYTFTNNYTMDTAFISEIDEVGVCVDKIDHAGTVSGTNFNCGEIISQSWGTHTVSAYVTVAGIRFESAKRNVEVTGIPYSTSTQASSLPSGWGGENLAFKGYNALGVGDSEACLRLKGESKTDQNQNGWIVSPAFHIPSSMGVTATAHTYLYRASFTATKGYLYAAASSGSYSTDTSNGIQKGSVVLFYDQASLEDFNYSLTLSSSKPRVTFYANNFTNPGTAWFTINRVDVKYR
jgi:hypothetical protein